MPGAPSKAPPAAPSRSWAPPVSRAPAPAHPSASTGSRGPGEVAPLRPSRVPKAMSPSSRPPIAASISPLPFKRTTTEPCPHVCPLFKGASSKPLADVCPPPDNFSKVPCSGSVGGARTGGSCLVRAIGMRSLGVHRARQRQRHADRRPLGRAGREPELQVRVPGRRGPAALGAADGVRDAGAGGAGGAGCCPGYRCVGGAHYMSDMILAEGVPGLCATRCHQGLRNWDREPTEQEQVPPGYYGPIRPVGVDKRGKYMYFEKSSRLGEDLAPEADGAYRLRLGLDLRAGNEFRRLMSYRRLFRENGKLD
ncbi:hypothetical protein DL768_003816 [Monosporascus sp. mg162]|nr:hypothetical protein DL768_003816 [Monosporascus sp. mg162]